MALTEQDVLLLSGWMTSHERFCVPMEILMNMTGVASKNGWVRQLDPQLEGVQFAVDRSDKEHQYQLTFNEAVRFVKASKTPKAAEVRAALERLMSQNQNDPPKDVAIPFDKFEAFKKAVKAGYKKKITHMLKTNHLELQARNTQFADDMAMHHNELVQLVKRTTEDTNIMATQMSQLVSAMPKNANDMVIHHNELVQVIKHTAENTNTIVGQVVQTQLVPAITEVMEGIINKLVTRDDERMQQVMKAIQDLRLKDDDTCEFLCSPLVRNNSHVFLYTASSPPKKRQRAKTFADTNAKECVVRFLTNKRRADQWAISRKQDRHIPCGEDLSIPTSVIVNSYNAWAGSHQERKLTRPQLLGALSELGFQVVPMQLGKNSRNTPVVMHITTSASTAGDEGICWCCGIDEECCEEYCE